MQKTAWLRGFLPKYLLGFPRMAGLAGFEPTGDGVKVRCLTAWRQPNIGDTEPNR